MDWDEVFSGRAGAIGLQWTLKGPHSRRLLRQEVQEMLLPGYHPGPLHLTRAKFKPGRKLLAYFTFSARDGIEREDQPLHLAVAWQNDLPTDDWSGLQEEANRAGLMPAQCALWRDLPERGMRLQLWPFDPAFPQLVRLGNPVHVAGMLAAHGIASNGEELPVVTPIRYRPRERHVLRYAIPRTADTPEGRQHLYAKLYSDAADAARAFGVANRVVDWLDANPVGLQGNRPQAMSQEDCVILYPHAAGVPLSRQLKQSRRWLAAQLQTIGRGLAVLHKGPETLQAGLRQNDFAKEARVVRRASEHIQILLPETYDTIIEILDKAQEYYSHLPQEKPTFTHADFKSDHLLCTPDGLTLIDFDTCTLTDPALDLGKFLADLEWWFTLQGISGVEEAHTELLKGYVGETGSHSAIDQRLARAKLFHTLIFTKIVLRRVPIYQKQWASVTEQMIRRAAGLLQSVTSAV